MEDNNDLKNKLIGIERTINIYTKNGSEPLEEVDITDIPLNDLKKIVVPEDSDPMLYDGYVLNPTQLQAINKLVGNKIKANYKQYNYILVCGGIYDWDDS